MKATPVEMASARRWLQSALSGAELPFSFLFGGTPSGSLLPTWTARSDRRALDARRIECTFSWRDPRSGLEVRWVATEYADFPAIEGILFLSNNAASDTELLENIQALDTVVSCSRGTCMLRYSRGAVTYMDDYAPVDRALNDARSELRLVAGGGRSSSDFLPFFNADLAGEGVVVGIGWTGEWAARFARDGNRLRIQAGMDLTRFRLHPGEAVRSPRTLMLFWQGDRMRGHNLLRGLILAHHCPQADGRPLSVPVLSPSWGSTPAAVHCANVGKLISHRLPIDYYWIDAEWHGVGPWWQNVGNWEIRRDLYPQGFKPISDLLHASGRKFQLWFEPHRVAPGTPWHREHGVSSRSSSRA
jgi:alpha-galactosidase